MEFSVECCFNALTGTSRDTTSCQVVLIKMDKNDVADQHFVKHQKKKKKSSMLATNKLQLHLRMYVLPKFAKNPILPLHESRI